MDEVLVATAMERLRTRRTAAYAIDVTSEADGALRATFQAMAFRTGRWHFGEDAWSEEWRATPLSVRLTRRLSGPVSSASGRDVRVRSPHPSCRSYSRAFSAASWSHLSSAQNGTDVLAAVQDDVRKGEEDCRHSCHDSDSPRWAGHTSA